MKITSVDCYMLKQVDLLQSELIRMKAFADLVKPDWHTGNAPKLRLGNVLTSQK